MEPLKIAACRVCGNKKLDLVLDLGNPCLSGTFPLPGEEVPRVPLQLVKCREDGDLRCGTLQLSHTADLQKMYGPGYGYRSSLNSSMESHLREIVEKIEERVPLQSGDTVLDIGSNDATLLRSYSRRGLHRAGIDPGEFENYYGRDPELKFIKEFFYKGLIEEKAKVITSIAMFYDLEDPVQFACDVYETLTDDGIWVFEQSYMPTMLERLGYDTVCHEHLEYYGLHQIAWILDRSGFAIADVELNDTNGGSFCVTAQKKVSVFHEEAEKLLAKEVSARLHKKDPYFDFADRVEDHRKEILEFFDKYRGDAIFGYGASTKGNTLLQYCGLTSRDLPCIADVNPDKFGRVTPGTGIPIISELEAISREPDAFFVLPYHFKDSILKRTAKLRQSGCDFVFPLPNIQIVSWESVHSKI